MKAFWRSRVLWLNLIVCLLAVADALTGRDGALSRSVWFLLAVGLLNGILRILTVTSLSR